MRVACAHAKVCVVQRGAKEKKKTQAPTAKSQTSVTVVERFHMVPIRVFAPKKTAVTVALRIPFQPNLGQMVSRMCRCHGLFSDSERQNCGEMQPTGE